MHDKTQPTAAVAALATDLDGTLIPLEGNEQNRADLELLRQHFAGRSAVLTFVTGRHLEIVEEAIVEHDLPQPDWIICDVGTSIYRRIPEGWAGETAYSRHLAGLCTLLPIDYLQRELRGVAGLTLQEPAKQGAFKLSYYVEQRAREEAVERIESILARRSAPWSLISSVDPLTGEGLVDLLPRGVSKAYALDWWRELCGFERGQVVFAGDSGNDWAALIAGYRAILVGNADRQLASRVGEYHAGRQWDGLLFVAEAPATSGVCEGCRAFGLFESEVEAEQGRKYEEGA
jgi:maltooligosyltrehalose trehalohydrolase